MAASSGTGETLELILNQFLEDKNENQDALLLELLRWRVNHLSKPDIIYPQWADKEPWLLEALKRRVDRHVLGLEDPRIDCWVEAYDSNDLPALWSCGMFDHRTLPYLYTPEAKVFPSQRPPAQPWKGRTPQPGQRIYDRSAKPERVIPGVWFRTCYACAGIFEYALDEHNSAYIWEGVPPSNIDYTAISYVWGDVEDLTIACSSCNNLTQFPFTSITKFREIMALVGSEHVAWLDAISIDQGNPVDVRLQMAQMGSIYKHAITVSVFLPQSDTEGYELLQTLSRLAKQILNRPTEFIIPPERRRADWSRGEQTSIGPGASSAKTDETLPMRQYESDDMASVCSSFLTVFNEYRERSAQLRYWQRAWTFQEWCLATDLEIGIEGRTSYGALSAVKTSIFSAACLLCQHKPRGSYSTRLCTDISQDAMRLWFEDVKHCFPLEEYILTLPERDPQLHKYQDQLPELGCDQLLGLRTQPRETLQQILPARLHIMLTAFDKTRSAKLEADLVACWATMCNLQYEYNPKENIMPQIVKVIRAIRDAGQEIFEFFPHLQDRSIRHHCLPTFFLFAERHAVQNYAVKGWGHRKGVAMYDLLPVFSGRCDPVVHLQQSLLQDFSRFSRGLDRVPYPSCYGRDPVQLVGSVLPSKFARVSSLDEATAIWKESLYGWVATPIFADLGSLFGAVVRGLPPEICSGFNIVQYHIPAYRNDGSAGVIQAWALTPITIPVSKLETVRRERDGVFALVCRAIGGGYMEVAYLTVTDQICGTILVRSDAIGSIDLWFDSPPTRDTMAGLGPEHDSRALHERRHLHARVTLEPWLHHLLPPAHGYHRELLLSDREGKEGPPDGRRQVVQRSRSFQL